MNLRFLVLSGNQIEVIENLMLLENLQFLDLSDNLIKECDEGKFEQWTEVMFSFWPGKPGPVRCLEVRQMDPLTLRTRHAS